MTIQSKTTVGRGSVFLVGLVACGLLIESRIFVEEQEWLGWMSP